MHQSTKNKINKICIILGTRPEIIKMSPIIRECERIGLGYFVLHTGQHYNKEMDEIFFTDLGITSPKYNLLTGGQPYGKQIGAMVRGITKILIKEKPDAVLVEGDTISVLAGALSANKLGIKVVHHEAGLRSNDLSMFEERIRVIVDHISDFLMTPTSETLNNLKSEGIDLKTVFLTGNTIVDAVKQNLKIANKKSSIIKKLKIKKKGYILFTCHRAENVDKKERLENILKGASLVQEYFKMPIIFPIHPRTKKNIELFSLKVPENIKIIRPLGFFDFLQLEDGAKLIMTDSGGVQEEAVILGVPCVTLRDNTERPESVKCKANIIAGSDPKNIIYCVKKIIKLYKNNKNTKNIFGKGKSGKKIIEIILQKL